MQDQLACNDTGSPEITSPFTKRVALITAFYAVILAIASMAGNNATKDIMLAQQRASNQWSYYQAKAVREHLYLAQKAQLKVVMGDSQRLTPATRAAAAASLAAIDKEVARFRSEKKQIFKTARDWEAKRDLVQQRDPYFDWAQILLQIAIILASIAMIITSGAMFSLSAVGAACGVLLLLNGFFFWLKLPWLH